MNYIVKDRMYIADEGYAFLLKGTEHASKKIALPKPEMIEYYEVVKLIVPPDGYSY